MDSLFNDRALTPKWQIYRKNLRQTTHPRSGCQILKDETPQAVIGNVIDTHPRA